MSESTNVASPWAIPQLSGYNLSRANGEGGEHSPLQKALEDGYEEGLAKGLLAAEQQISDWNEDLQRLLMAFQSPLKTLDEQISSDLLLMATQLAEVLVRHQLQIQPELIQPLVDEALSSLEDATASATIYFNEQDLSLINQDMKFDYQGKLQMEPSPNLKRGDIEIKTQQARVDAKLAQRFQQIFQSLSDSEDIQEQSN